LKKLCSIILVAIFILGFSLSAFAEPPADSTVEENAAVKAAEEEAIRYENRLDYLITGRDIKSTDQFLVTATKPVGGETTFDKSYVICGFTDKDDISFALAVYDEDAESYVDLKDTDNESRWNIDSFGIFAKEVMLKEGQNIIKLVAYVNTDKELVLGDNLQVNYFTITVMNKSIKDRIINTILKISDIFKGVIDKK